MYLIIIISFLAVGIGMIFLWVSSFARGT